MTPITGTSGDDPLPGTSGDDSILGMAGNDSLLGFEGNDVLDGGSNDDTLWGGTGNDTLIGGAGNDLMQGDSGVDTLTYASSPAGVTVTKPQASVTIGTATDGFGGTDTFGHGTADDLIGSAFDDVLTGSPIYTAAWGEIFGRDAIRGGAGNDSISGLGGDDLLEGDDGDDTLLGGDGDDELHGGAGNDSLVGGNGQDVVDYGSSPGAVNVNLGTGLATGADGNDTLSQIEGAGGSSFNDTLTGSGADEYLGGMQGNDVLDGAGGFDIAYYGDAPGAVSVNLATGLATGADGTDTLANFEGIRGSDFDDVLVGDGGANKLAGSEGGDTLRGGGGNDSLDGGYDFDTAVFTGIRSQYTIAYDSSSGLLSVADNVAGRDGTDALFSVEALQFSDQTVTAGGGAGNIDPSGTYLATAPEDHPHRPADSALLADLGLAPGDVITITRTGAYKAGVNFNDVNGSMLAVFSDGTSFVAPAVYSHVTSLPQATTQAATDIPQDFFVMGSGTTMVQIPVGATTILFSPNDSFFSDNTDPDGNYGVSIRRVDAATSFSGNDLLFGTVGDDTLLGGAGRDTLVGGAGNDYLDGGVIADRIEYTDLNVLTYATSPSAVRINLSGITGNGSGGGGTVSDGFGTTDKVANVNFIVGSNFDDEILGSSAAIFEEFTGGAGNDTIDGGTIDTVLQANSNRVNYAGATGAVSVNFTTGVASGGDQGTDTLQNINHVRGSTFDDTLTGSDSAFSEQFEGIAGNDTIDGKGGIDVVRYDSAASAVTVDLASSIAQDGLGGTDTLLNIEGIRGSRFGDVLTGGNPANGTGTIDGFEFFTGNAGNDTIDGGGGYDRADYTTSTSGVTVTLGGTGTGSAQDGLGGTDTLISIEAVRGSDFGDVLTGSDSGTFESFEGREGNDTIDGQGGTDRADYNFNPSGVNVNLATGTARDGWGDTDTLSNIENVRGSAFDDTVVGDGGDNRLEGGAGNDTIEGGAGNDYFVGGAGTDTLTYANSASGVTVTKPQDAATTGSANDGFGGVDTIEQGAADILIGSAFDDVLTGSPVHTSALPDVFGGDEIHGGAGNDLVIGLGGVDLLHGDAGNDTLLGGAGDDELYGGAGDDSLDGGDGFDIAFYDGATSAVNANLKTGVATGGAGNDQLTGIEAVSGSSFADTLTGSDGDDFLAGQLGNDILDGGAGFDVLYYGDAAASISVNLGTNAASGGDGVDTISNVEGVIGSGFGDALVGSAAANLLEGGGGNDVISGGAGNDTLEGGAGDDTLDGGDGTDTARFAGSFGDYAISSGQLPGELIVSGPDGRDLLRNVEVVQFDDRSLTFILGTTGADALTVAPGAGPVIVDAGQGDDVVTGNDSGNALLGGGGNDQLSGGTGSDNLDGGTGNDVMTGGAGDDVYGVDSAGDQVVEAGVPALQPLGTGMHPADINLGGGIDKVVASISYTLGAFVENLTLAGGAGHLSGTGNALGNVMQGNAGNNRLDGLAGSDSLGGGDGNDTLVGGEGDDTIDGGSGLDTALYTGTLASHSIIFNETGFTVSGPDGTDVLSGVERLQFADFNMAFDVEGNAGQAYRLYQAAFNRSPDVPGLGFQMNALDVGWGLVQIAQNFIDSPEFSDTYGALDNAQFVTRLYLNVLHRAPEDEGLAYHVARLESGVPRSGILVGFSESPENQAALIGVIGNGMVYTV